MQRSLVIAAVSALVFVTAPGAGAAAPYYHHHHQARIASFPVIQDRYCLQGRSFGYPGNCEFSTFQQCRAAASGTDSGCGINPMRAYARQRPGYY